MRTARELIASLGAGGSLVAAGVCLLAVVSAVVGFRGWPDVAGVGDAPERLVLAEPGPEARRAAAADERAAALELPRETGGSARTTAERRRARGREDPRRPRHAHDENRQSVSGGAAPGTSVSTTPAAAPSLSPGKDRPASPRADPGPEPTGPPASSVAAPRLPAAPSTPATPSPGPAPSVPPADQAVEDLVGTAGDAVEPVAPEAAEIVRETTTAVGEVVEGVGGLLDGDR